MAGWRVWLLCGMNCFAEISAVGWLAAVSVDLLHHDELEPISIDGLGNMTAAQKALAEFLEVGPDLLAGAGMGRPTAQNGDISEKEMDKWIHSLPQDEVNPILKQLLEGKGQQAERTIRNRFAAWLRSLQTDKIDTPRCTVRELRQNAEMICQTRLEKQKRDREKQ